MVNRPVPTSTSSATSASSRLPVAAYQVSGEYAMIKFGAQAGAIDEDRVVRKPWVRSSAPART